MRTQISVVKNFMKFSMECIKIKAWDDESFGTDLVDWKRKQSGERDDFFF